MKPIETRYKGNRFRSRLEARWAVFFDTMGIPFQYEPEGFKFDDGTYYLPDFWLPEQKAWVEIKGGDISSEDEHKVIQLAQNITDGQRVCILGNIPRVEYRGDYFDNNEFPYVFVSKEPSGKMFSPFFGENFSDTHWMICPLCQHIDLYQNIHGVTCDCVKNIDLFLPATPEQSDWESYWWITRALRFYCHTEDHPHLMMAYLAASQARFEHGEGR